MQAQFTAFLYVCAALCLGFVLTRKVTSQSWYNSALIFWFASALIIFIFAGSNGICLTLLAAALLFVTPRFVEQKLPYLLFIYCAVPSFLIAAVPFPFINYLINLNFPMLLGLIVMLPVLIGSRRSNEIEHQPGNWVTFFVLTYFIVTTTMMYRILPVTATLRFGAEAALGIFMVYPFIMRFATSEPVLERAMTAIYVAAVVLACLALLSQIKHWNFYSVADTNAPFWTANEMRYGILRTSVTTIPALFGFLEVVGFILLIRQKNIAGRLPRFGLLIGLLLVMGSVVSLSRGAWLSGLVAVGSYLFLKSRLSNASVVVIGLCSVALALFFFFGKDFSTNIDPFQTFEYRRELFKVSWDQFLSAPIVGSPDFRSNERFDELIQGQGIVDFLSVYLEIALPHGLVGLMLYLAPYILVLRGVLRLRSHSFEMNQQARTQIASLGAILFGYMILIFTISGVSLVVHYGVIFLALANAAVVGANQRLAQRKETSLNFPELVLKN